MKKKYDMINMYAYLKSNIEKMFDLFRKYFVLDPFFIKFSKYNSFKLYFNKKSRM